MGLVGGAAALGPLVSGREARAAGRPPNFVVIFTDDQGYRDIGCFGSPDIRTPALDRMAAEGTRLTDFYVAASVCSPSRAALLTGCYPPRVGVPGVLFPRSKTGLNPDEVTIADMLKARGYATMCIGKWHLGWQKQFLPTRQGFDSYYGVPYSNDMTIAQGMAVSDDLVLRDGVTREGMWKSAKNRVPLMRDEEVIEYPCDQTTLTKRYTEEAIRFFEANREKPFFLYLPHTMPHVPLFASERFKGKSRRGIYGDVIEEIDWSTGEILGALGRLGLDRDTLVIYTSDNGPWLSKGKAGGCALPLRSGKFNTYEGGMREPCIARWPGRVPAGRVSGEVAATIDFLPTFAALSGARVPPDRVIDGKDITPVITGERGAKSPHEAFYYYKGNRLESVRSGKWKLRVTGAKRRRGKPKPGDERPKPKENLELYDLAADISEKRNLAGQHPDVASRLRDMMLRFDKELKGHSRPCGRA
jgi:arylsulfatase A-like enzyme